MQTLELLDLSHLFAQEVPMEEEEKEEDGDMPGDVSVEEEDADM